MTKKSLLIGINRYRIPGVALRGCINDVHRMQAVLIEHCGFADRDIAVLTDLAATKKAIETAIRRLTSGSKRGDVLYLHFSGYGSNVPDISGDEADRRDEILCSADLDWKDPLRGDWLGRNLDKVPAGVNVTIVLDCCQSGTVTRALSPDTSGPISRYLPCPSDLVHAESGRRLTGRLRSRRSPRSQGFGGREDAASVRSSTVLITACSDGQSAMDDHIGDGYHGALTYYMEAAIRHAKGRLTYRELHQRTRDGLVSGRFSQEPQLEAAKKDLDRPFVSPLD